MRSSQRLNARPQLSVFGSHFTQLSKRMLSNSNPGGEVSWRRKTPLRACLKRPLRIRCEKSIDKPTNSTLCSGDRRANPAATGWLRRQTSSQSSIAIKTMSRITCSPHRLEDWLDEKEMSGAGVDVLL